MNIERIHGGEPIITPTGNSWQSICTANSSALLLERSTWSDGKTFNGHKDSVTVWLSYFLSFLFYFWLTSKALTFRHASDDLYSGSADRSVKIWDCQSLSYVDTLYVLNSIFWLSSLLTPFSMNRYGHELPITGIDSQFHERCITSSEDCTVRLWKIAEGLWHILIRTLFTDSLGTQLVFRAEKLNLDCISYLSEEKWVTGSQQGYDSFISYCLDNPLELLICGVP